jgi:hypothetical protein
MTTLSCDSSFVRVVLCVCYSYLGVGFSAEGAEMFLEGQVAFLRNESLSFQLSTRELNLFLLLQPEAFWAESRMV